MFQIEEHRICVCVRARPLNKKGESWCLVLLSPVLSLFNGLIISICVNIFELMLAVFPFSFPFFI